MANLALNGIFPEQPADQQQIQQRLAMAQALMQSGMAPSNPTQTASGGFAIPESPLNGLAKLAQVWAGKKMQADANKASTAMNQAYAQRLADMFGVNNTADQSLQGQGPLKPENQVPNTNPQQSSLVIPGMTPQQAMFAYQNDQAGYMRALVAALKTPDAIRTADLLGVSRADQSAAANREAATKGLMQLKSGQSVFNPQSQQFLATAPDQEKGLFTQWQNGSPSESTMPGAPSAIARSNPNLMPYEATATVGDDGKPILATFDRRTGRFSATPLQSTKENPDLKGAGAFKTAQGTKLGTADVGEDRYADTISRFESITDPNQLEKITGQKFDPRTNISDYVGGLSPVARSKLAGTLGIEGTNDANAIIQNLELSRNELVLQKAAVKAGGNRVTDAILENADHEVPKISSSPQTWNMYLSGEKYFLNKQKQRVNDFHNSSKVQPAAANRLKFNPQTGELE